MVNIIWFNLILIGLTFSIITGNDITETILSSPQEALKLCVQLFPNLALWLGIMKIAEASGLINKIAQKTKKIIKPLFKEIPENHSSLGYIASNIIINMLGVGNAATPFGLKAMKSMQELNQKDYPSKSMITFLVINTSGLTIIPTTVLSLRTYYKSVKPSKIILPCIIVTLLSTITSLIIDYIFRKVTK